MDKHVRIFERDMRVVLRIEGLPNLMPQQAKRFWEFVRSDEYFSEISVIAIVNCCFSAATLRWMLQTLAPIREQLVSVNWKNMAFPSQIHVAVDLIEELLQHAPYLGRCTLPFHPMLCSALYIRDVLKFLNRNDVEVHTIVYADPYATNTTIPYRPNVDLMDRDPDFYFPTILVMHMDVPVKADGKPDYSAAQVMPPELVQQQKEKMADYRQYALEKGQRPKPVFDYAVYLNGVRLFPMLVGKFPPAQNDLPSTVTCGIVQPAAPKSEDSEDSGFESG